MMMRLWGFLGVVTLSACGGGGGGSDDNPAPVDPRLARLDVYEAQKLRVLGDPDGSAGMPTTPVDAIPPMGRATFTGSTSIRVEDSSNPLVLFGDSSVTILFDDGSVGGTLDRFFGTNANGDVADYAGQISIDGGSIDDGVSLEYAGVLNDAADSLIFEGTMDGTFLGDPIAALTAVDLEAVVIAGGTPMDATVIVIGETPGVE